MFLKTTHGTANDIDKRRGVNRLRTAVYLSTWMDSPP